MTNRKILTALILFLIVLACFRLPWMLSSPTPSSESKADQGVLDLSGWDFDKNHLTFLDGEWEFYPDQFLTSDQIEIAPEKSHISVPESFPSKDIFGTYRLRVFVADQENQQLFNLQLPHQPRTSKIFVNHEIQLSNDLNNQSFFKKDVRLPSRPIPFSPNENNEIEIIIHVTDTSQTKRIGFQKSIPFGPDSAISKRHIQSIAMQLLVAGIALLHFVYASLIFFINPKNKDFLYFALASLCVTLATALDDDKLLLFWLSVDYLISVKLLVLLYLGIAAFFLLFFKNLFPEHRDNKLIQTFSKFHLLIALFIVFLPSGIIGYLLKFVFITVVLTFILIACLTWQTLKKGNSDSLFLVLAASAATSSFLWGFYKSVQLTELTYYPFDIIIAFLAFSLYLFKRSFKMSDDNKNLAKRLQKEIRQKDDFLANTSHELRNPLHGIINIAQSVLKNKTQPFDEKSEKNIELIAAIGIHMSRTLNDLLDVTRLRENQILLQKEHLDLHTVASGVIDMLKFMVDNKDIQLEIQIPSNFPDIYADKNRVIQILFNLIHNAIKYTNDGMITVDACVQDGVANIHIMDSGIGLEEEIIYRIFEPYEQSDSSITAGGSGLGLGLSICKQLVEMHGGTLKVDSILGEGSTFTFTMPLARDSQLETSKPILTTDPAKVAFETKSLPTYPAISNSSQNISLTYRPKILAVDDDPVNLKVLSSIFSDSQYEIQLVTSGKEALQQLELKEWDLVISDVMMPNMSGYELTRSIREKFSITELPILLLTARSQPEDIYAGFLAGANDYIVKPIDALELTVRVHVLTDLKKSINDRLQMEAAWLQAQIQPHFLFNTLNTIVSLSETDTNRMALLLNKFGSYLRNSFDSKNLERIVPLQHELELLRSYIYIEKERFGDRLQVHWDIEGENHILIPPLSLQTLVENAINHGILKRIEGGNVTIRIREKQSLIEFSVIDDGVGMSEEKLKQVFQSISNKTRGIGLLNTNQRLKQLYGIGLSIQSVLGEGTTVTFKIPK